VYLNELNIEVPSLFDPSRKAVVDEAHCRWLNREIFFFADEREMAEFDREPHRWAGALTDPVSGERFRPGTEPVRTVWRDKPWYFASDATRQPFLLEPMRWIERPAAMLLPEKE
jgi:YHS domain-containing protein